MPCTTSSAVTKTEGGTSCAAPIRASASGTVHDVAIAFLASARDASASTAPGSTHNVVQVGEFEFCDAPHAGPLQILRHDSTYDRCRGSAVVPGQIGDGEAKLACPGVHARITAGVESMSVPSKSKMTASKTSSVSRPKPTAVLPLFTRSLSLLTRSLE